MGEQYQGHRKLGERARKIAIKSIGPREVSK
jgi:hypothetical protein